jgi:hypothetical protein
MNHAVCQAKGEDEEGLRDSEEEEVGPAAAAAAAAAAEGDCGGGDGSARKSESTHVMTACSVPLADMGRFAAKRRVADADAS